ncbi:MAG: cytidine deaminase [Anaerolineae bacterium]|nr:cytidine deaminase [Anaerolineae bacterium]
MDFDRHALAQRALDARRNAYAPYSDYPVGSALLTTSGAIYTAASVENADYPATICAPNGAFLNAVSEGQRDFVALAIATRDGDPPCGICRQVITEFAPNLTILLVNESGTIEELPFAAVMARPFGTHPA